MTFRDTAIRHLAVLMLVSTVLAAVTDARGADTPVGISGRYPHLATLNHQGECGTGAVAAWADRLWVITYAPHKPEGSDDQLYEIDADLHRVARPESVGGTPADRMIHQESNQLIIGPYFIDAQRQVRVIPPKTMPGRLTAVTRHLTDPANKVYMFDMEGTLYEVDVHTLHVTKLFARVAPGAHGKGAYSGQGRLVVANNGNIVANKVKPAAQDPDYATDPEASGVLAAWDGKAWSIIERRQFTDITGPGGLTGSPTADAPLWALGWDKRSVILKLLEAGQWHDFRLPIADRSYVAKHGWYTEWPRIRAVTGGKLLLNMHGGWYDFPATFSMAHTGGLQPLGSYLKITGDFCPWQDRIVFGCDDASIMDNPLLGQSQSNLWFSSWEGLKACGAPAGVGGPWIEDAVHAAVASAPFLFSGYAQRVVHLSHDSDQALTFTIELDAQGDGQWTAYKTVTVPPHGYAWHVFAPEVQAAWVRLKTDRDCAHATAYFHYGPGGGSGIAPELFAAVQDAGASTAWSSGSLRPLGADAGTLLLAAHGAAGDPTLLELGPDLQFKPYGGTAPKEPSSRGAATPYKVSRDDASIIVTQGHVHFRLPISNAASDEPGPSGPPRSIREIVTERFILNAGGSMYMLPRESANGVLGLKPICTHNKRISDFCSWRGLLALAGNRLDAPADGHYIATADHAAGLWLGDIDDLWKLGKPRGHGGPWLRTAVTPDHPSDPYLMTGYDHKTIELSHDAAGPVMITLEVDFLATGSWNTFRTIEIPAGQKVTYEFPAGYAAHWLRARANTACQATVQLQYD